MTTARRAGRSVFDVYAHEYDLITNAEARESYHRKELKALVERFRPKRVLDAGCANGLAVRLLADLGVDAVGLDRASGMIAAARQRYAGRENISFVQGEFERLPRKLDGRFDLLVCLANSISGVTKRADLLKAMRGFRRVLRPGGHLVMQSLNIDALEDGEVFPIKATENDGVVYERFLERRGRRCAIWVTRADIGETPTRLEVFHHWYSPHDRATLRAALGRANFMGIRAFGDLAMNKRVSKACRDIVLAARRPSQ